LKEMRAALELVRRDARDGDDAARFEQTRRALRDWGRLLAPVREADAVTFTLDELVARAARKRKARERDPAHTVRRARAEAARERATVQRAAGAIPAAIAADDVVRPDVLVELARGAHESAARFGVRRAYRRCREHLAVAARDPTPENMHELRKRAKLARAHVAMLADDDDGDWTKTSAHLDELNDLLGDAHDLELLARWLDEHAPAPKLHAYAERRRDKLHRRALHLAARVFDEKPRTFARRLLHGR
jgi:CHAD domain-containing protein